MRTRTKIRTASGRDRATLMTVSFEAGDPQVAARVLNAYLNHLQAADAEIRRGRSSETLAFFRQAVQRLDQDIDAHSARILAFRKANLPALPDSLDYRISRRASLEERLLQTRQEITRLKSQRLRLVALFDATAPTTREQAQADQRQLSP